MKLRIFADLALPQDAIDLLRAGTAGHDLLFPRVPAASVLAKADLDPQLPTADIAFGQPDIEGIAEAAQMKWVHVGSSGYTRYDTAKFRSLVAEKGIRVTNSASVYCEPCAYHVLSMMLAQARRLPPALASRAASGTPEWLELRGSCTPFRGQTALILGYGAIGKRLVEFLRPFGIRVLAYRRKARGDEGVPVIGDDQLGHTLANEADHIINILPESPETRHFFDSARFAQVRHGAIFYNIGRGATVDQTALLSALHSGHLGAAWLDVTSPEPLPDGHPLLSAPNCYITPHIAGGHVDEAKSLVNHFLSNLKRYLLGEPLLDQIM